MIIPPILLQRLGTPDLSQFACCPPAEAAECGITGAVRTGRAVLCPPAPAPDGETRAPQLETLNSEPGTTPPPRRRRRKLPAPARSPRRALPKSAKTTPSRESNRTPNCPESATQQHPTGYPNDPPLAPYAENVAGTSCRLHSQPAAVAQNEALRA